ncbi:hypothetical protein [Myxococcus sp. AM010]|uniref:hypothetical protein n=1 Tax=Myxococcus sp. AM010 TaxID=2745138 RepID=UPI0020D13BE7|nr:hypothetical protein [Myxococcus sp. AM010]
MPELLAEMLLPEGDDGGGAQAHAHLVTPAAHQLPEGQLLLVLGQRLQPAPLPVGLHLQVMEEGLRFGLGGGLGRGVAPSAMTVLEADVPLVVLAIDGTHRTLLMV